MQVRRSDPTLPHEGGGKRNYARLESSHHGREPDPSWRPGSPGRSPRSWPDHEWGPAERIRLHRLLRDRAGAIGLEYLGIASAAAALRSAVRVAFPDGPVPADEREENTLGLPEPVLERIEGELSESHDLEDAALYDAFARAYRDRPNDFGPT